MALRQWRGSGPLNDDCDADWTETGQETMTRKVRSSQLETRSARLRLAPAWKPYFVRLGRGLALGYRRTKTAGTWVVRVSNGAGSHWTKAIGIADDFEDSGASLDTLDFDAAQNRARAVARSGQPDEDGTVRKALDRYEADLRTRGGDVANVVRVRNHLGDKLSDKNVARLVMRDLRSWRDGLAKHLAPASVNRTVSMLRAALNLAADQDERIGSRRPWEIGLATIPDAEQSRNVILREDLVRVIIAAAYRESEQFGLLVELAAVTGARVSQLRRLEVQDVQGDRVDPRLMMPSSAKGYGKKVIRRPVPIPVPLAARLRLTSAGKPGNAALMVKPGGEPWRRSDHSRLFKRTVRRAGVDPSEVTIYALRHSNIVRQILANVPIRIVAVNHDTSVATLERTYSRHIADHSDGLAREALLDTTVPAASASVMSIHRSG
jgi:integrase